MHKNYVLGIAFLSLLVNSCESEQKKISVKYSGSSMNNTLVRGVAYNFVKQDRYSNNDIIAFENKDILTGENAVSIYRIIGVPGDTIQFINGLPYRNGSLFKLPPTSKRIYFCKGENLNNIFDHYEILARSNDTVFVNLTEQDFEKLSSKYPQLQIKRHSFDKSYLNPIIKFNSNWNRDFFGPILIPKRLTLSDTSNILLPPSFNVKDILLDSSYFVIGDNIQYSFDSRYIGLIPKKIIMGKLIE